MAHYAILDGDNYVVNVIVGKDENEIVLDENGNAIDWEIYYGGKRTSYNTRGGVHLEGGTPFRMNYAGIGYRYDSYRDAFIPPKPYPSWIWNESKCMWKAPIELPGTELEYYWDEISLSWRESKID